MRARDLTIKHFKRGDYPVFLDKFDSLIRTLDRLAILGVIEPPAEGD